jgi:hypothetical protein
MGILIVSVKRDHECVTYHFMVQTNCHFRYKGMYLRVLPSVFELLIMMSTCSGWYRVASLKKNSDELIICT